MTHVTFAQRRADRLLALTATIAAIGLTFVASPALANHGEPFGANFGLADAVDSEGEHVDVFNGPKALWSGVCDTEARDTGGTGIGTAPLSLIHCIDPGDAYFELADQQNPNPPIETTWQPGKEPQWRLDMASQAGAHPDMSLSFWLQRSTHRPAVEGGTGVSVISDGEPKDTIVKLPAGFVGNPNAVPQCSAEAARNVPPACPPETQIGISEISLARAASPLPGGGSLEGSTQRVPVWNVEPREGKLAEFMISANINESARVNIPIVAKARTDGDFGIDALALNLSPGLPFVGQTITLWGVPFDPAHDKYRPPTQYVAQDNDGIPREGLPDKAGNQPQGYEPSWGPVKPFLVNATECNPAAPPETGLVIASWRYPSDLRAFSAEWDGPITGCDSVPFGERGVAMDIAPTSTVADGPTGLTADVTIPQIDEPPVPAPTEASTPGEVSQYLEDAEAHWESEQGLSTAQLEKAVVTLPQGVSVNPSSATGLAACSDAAFGLLQQGPPATFNNEDPFDGAGAECPAGSRIGTVELYSPILPRIDETPGEPNLKGAVVLGEPKSTDPQSGEMFRLLLVVKNERRGLIAKIAGSATADPNTGQLTTTFEQNPRVPFETMRLRLRGGDRGTLALQQRCEARGWSSLLSPWTAAHGQGGVPVENVGAFQPTANCAFGFSPDVRAGMSSRRGGGSGFFSYTLSRDDGEQWVGSLAPRLPRGLVAAVGSVPLCSNALADAAACPEPSRIGTVDAAAGSGAPFVLERKGGVYLTEGYKGAPYGLATVVPVEVGPFRGPMALKTIVVRQAVRVDPTDASVTVESDPLPQIWHGIPLRMRSVTVRMDRVNFMRNPTDCSPKQIVSSVRSTEGSTVQVSTPFQASGCGQLPFRPRLAMRFVGKKQVTTGKHPGVRAVVTQGSGQAAIKNARVVLPKTIALDPNNAGALCEFVDGTKPEPTCPAGSIVGRARAVSPLLSRPLTGNVYFVKNIRIDPVTGAPRRTLPMLVVALRGEIAVNVRGESNVTRNLRLVNTFSNVPDAPISRFELNLEGGRNGILVVTDSTRGRLNICGRQIAEADMDGHNGRRYDRNIRIKTPCKKLKKRRVARRKR